nr:efflux RND transporter periplasmic adaptor subunit [Desulfobulbaceae bacterium]
MIDDNKDNIVSSDTHIPTRNLKQRLLALAMVVVLLGVGVASFKYLMASKPEAKRRTPDKMQALVEVMKVRSTVEPVIVKAFGRIKPAKEIALQSRVAGMVVSVHPDLVRGGMVAKGDVIAQLDDTDFNLAVKQKKDALAQANADLRLEEGSQNVARQEWELISTLTDVDSSTADIALRKPQLAKAQVKIQTAQTEVEKAELDLSRTTVRAPFSAIVREKHVNTGSQITTQTVIATLVGVDSFWIEITVPTNQLQWIVMPGGGGQPSNVTVFSGENRFKGKILKLLPDLEQDGLMARILVEISKPMSSENNKAPLLINSFVRVEIRGREISNIYKIPRSALQDKRNVYVATQEETLHILPVTVAWEDAEFAYIAEGLNETSRLIVSQLPAPIEAMPLKIAGQEPWKSKGTVKE